MTVWYAGAYAPAYQTVIYAQFFMYVYFYSLHFSGSHVSIIRRIIVSVWHLVYVTLCRWPSGTLEHMLLHTRRSSTHNFSCMFISILYTFRAAMCPSSGELLYQCDTWFMSLCVDDRLVCYTRCHIDTIIFVMMGTWLPETCREWK